MKGKLITPPDPSCKLDMLKTKRFYDSISYFYPVIDFFLRSKKIHLIEELNKLPFGNVLDVGIGNGSHLNLYKKHHITGIDISSKMLGQARKKDFSHVQLFEMNGEQMTFKDQSFDYVILSHILSVTQDPDVLLHEAHRVLKSNGKVLILNHFTPNNILKYVDRIFQPFARLFCFRSLFHIERLNFLQKFSVEKDISIGPLNYYKLLILAKR